MCILNIGRSRKSILLKNCNGCGSDGCPDNDSCENKKCSITKELSHCYKCEENCRKGLLGKIKLYTFSLFAKQYGEKKLLDCLERNEKNGVMYLRDGINGDYDEFDDVEELMEFILKKCVSKSQNYGGVLLWKRISFCLQMEIYN